MRKKLNKTTVRNLDAKATRYEVADTETPPFRVRVAPSGIKTFILRYRNAENRTRLFTIGKFGDLTPELAREIAQKKLAEIKLGKDPAAEKQEMRREAEREQYMTFGGFLEKKYGPWVTANRKSGYETLRMLNSRFAEMLDKRLDEITPWLVEKWRKGRIAEGRTVSTVNRNLVALKAALSVAVDWGLIEQHPLARVKLGKVDQQAVVRYLSPDEERRLRNALEARDADLRAGRERGNTWRRERGRDTMPELGTYADHLTPLVLLSLNTGVRRGEALNLQWSDVAMDRASIAIRGDGTKSGKTRHVPINDEAMEVLRTWMGQGSSTGHVFPSKTGARLDNVRKSWAGVLDAAKITGFRWHDMRHHFASRLVMAGVDLNTVRELLGHSDIKMTLRYSHLAPEHKAAAVAKLTRAV